MRFLAVVALVGFAIPFFVVGVRELIRWALLWTPEPLPNFPEDWAGW